MRRTALFAPHVLQSKNDEKQNNYVSCESCFWIPGNSERSNDLTNSWQSTIPCTLHVPCLDAKMASSIGPANLQLCEMRASFLSYLSSALLSPSEVNGEKDQKGPTRIKAQSISKPNMHTWTYMVIHDHTWSIAKATKNSNNSYQFWPFPSVPHLNIPICQGPAAGTRCRTGTSAPVKLAQHQRLLTPRWCSAPQAHGGWTVKT